jgi:hypothetical protein
MGVRRFTRLTNAFSKKFENHCHMVAIYHAYYNFCRVHQTLRVTPAMEAGLTDHIWSVKELVSLLDQKLQIQAAALLTGMMLRGQYSPCLTACML